MKRSAGLKTNPEKLRAWQQRSKPLKRGKGPRAKAPAKMTNFEREAKQRFQRAVLGRPCHFAEHRPGHVCAGRKDPHHLLPQRAIKLRLKGADEQMLVNALWNPAIGAPLCRKAHDLVEARIEHVWWEELTLECIEFSESIGMVGRLLLACPQRPVGRRSEMEGELLTRGCPECAGTVANEICRDCGAVFA